MGRGQQLLYLIKSINQGKELAAVLKEKNILSEELKQTQLALDSALITTITLQNELNTLHEVIEQINGEEVTNE